ncbi:LIM and calponin homology domains-containing protein 1-like [Ylistrum balloti]|uniref:LIM and calponin homology domains-containing protein 1-like n=1 Tax=Ylistrum balloti TaxID=509963 RepID=UPI002905BA0C|nr:LIM and calponin homology domains-containing protein 1-like [Ylistrum balloti]
MASEEQNDDDAWDLRMRQEEEEDFFTELALHETERWISAVTRKKFQYPDDFRKSLENGVLLCELLNTIKPGVIKRINKLPGPIAGLDNINVYLQTCRNSFQLTEAHLFDCTDLEDLSQRAISDSEHILKQESDRRVRNVAIGIYWLGKSVYHTYSGPQLDFSAFTPLVHHNGKDIISEDHFQQDNCEFGDQSSSCGSNEIHDSVRQSVDNKHVRDSAYDSYGSLSNSRESELSFSLEESNMPGVQMRRADSTSSINRSGDFSLARNSEDDSLYQSTPDLSSKNSHTRTSSTDSMDGHVSIPTRSHERKTSTTSANPLQFVKVNSSNDMAKVASMQMKMSEEVKKVRSKNESDEQEWQSPWANDQDEDWKANFSDWRNKRRRKSEAQLQRVEETDKSVKEEEEKRQVKSYGQMVEERERRKSTGTFLKKPMSFYPVDDNDDLFTPVKVPSSAAPVEEKVEKISAPKVEASSRERTKAPMLSSKDRPSSLGGDGTYIHYDDTRRASWAASDSSDEESNKKDNSVESERLQDTSVHESRNKEKSTTRKSVLDSDSSWRKDSTPQRNSGLSGPPVKSIGKLSNLLKSFEQKEEEAKVDYSKVKKFSDMNKDYSRSGLSKSFDLPSSSFSFSAKDKAETTPVRSRITDKTVPVPTKASVEKAIKISQKPNNKKGFGFVISGGADKREPVTVQKVSLGSAADVCEVQQNDKILAINKRDISSLAHAQIQRLIDEAVRHGQIELKVKRSISDGDDEYDEEEDSAFITQSPTSPIPKLSSALSPRTRGSSGSSTSSTGHNSRVKSPTGYVSPLSGDKYGSATRTENRYGSVSPVRSQRTRNQSPSAAKPESYRRNASPVENRNINSSSTETSYRSGSPSLNQHSYRSGSPSLNQHSGLLPRESSPLGSRSTPDSASLTCSDPSPVTTRNTFTQEDRTGSPLQRSSPLFKSPSESPSGPSDSKIYFSSTEKSRLEEETNNNDIKVNDYIKGEFIKSSSPVGNGNVVDETITPVRKEKDFSSPVQHDVMSSQKAPETEITPKQEVTISTRETITVKKNDPPEVKSSHKWEPHASPPVSTSPPPVVEEDDGGGPPAILRRWQQRKPRPQSAYSAYPAFESPKEEKRLSANYPWESSIIDKKNDTEQEVESQVIKLDHQENNSMPPPKTQVGQPVTLEIPDHTEPQAKKTSIQIASSHNPGLLQIDPRNQMTENDNNLPEYSFHVSLNKQQEARTFASPDMIEQERELIRQEEQQVLAAEKKQWEEEETRRIREKEEELQRQAEMLRLEKEKLKREQERMQKEREELERSRKKQLETKENRPETKISHHNNNPKSQFSTSVNTDSKQSLRKLDLTWPPQKEEPPPRQKLTREDMLAMNRRATPLQRKPEMEVNSTEPSKTKDFTSRDVPTKNDLHNLTAVPKPKYRSSSNWMKEDPQPLKTVSKARSDNNRSSPNLHEHWLVEEAERRRKATANQNSHGAIQPGSDGIVNRWRDDSFLPKQQASINAQGSNLTQPRSLSSNVSHNHGQDNRQYIPASQNTKAMSQTLPQNFNYSSLSPKNRGDPYAPPKPTRNSSSSTTSSISSPSSPLNPSEQFMAVSGKQACSYCSQELGFGAAMVIESLGLYYHVQCFRCCVCHTALGNGSQGADVRVRVNKLHCRNCYSNDEAGLKFSKV